MKGNARHTNSLTAWLLMCILSAGLFSSCSALIDEDLSGCLYGTGIRFEYLIYDDDGGAADAFSTSVDRVALHIFDDEGKHVATRTEEGEALRNPQWRMTLDLDPGTYHLVAWAGLDGVSFRGQPSCIYKEDACVELNCEGNLSQEILHPLWHGAADIVVEKEYTEHTVSLVKDTRRIRIVLQQIDDEPLDAADFRVSITDDNSLLGHDNLPVPNGLLTYRPYADGQQVVGGNGEIGNGSGSATVAYAEFSTSRLVEGNRPRLRIDRDSDGETIVDIPLLDYLLLRRPEASMLTDQQFLDRNDAYTLVFFLDDGLSWLKTQIIINGWVIRLNSGTIGD